MDLRPTAEQRALQEAMRSFCEKRLASERLAELEGSIGGVDRELWGELAGMGVFGLRLAEARGGSGLGHVESVLVFAELGRAAAPGPLVWSHLAADFIDGAGCGDVVVGGIDLTGACSEPIFIEHLDGIDVLLVLRDEGVYRIDPASVDAVPIALPLDPLTPVRHVEHLPSGERVGDAEVAAGMRLEGAALVAAELFGIAAATLDLALAYSQVREQFGRAIGSFQAVKHMLADMLVRREAARAAVYVAAATLEDPAVGSVERAVAAAKLTAGQAAAKNSRACIQVYGGMGFTWEVPAHYYLKRAWALQTLFADRDEHTERLAELVELGR